MLLVAALLSAGIGATLGLLGGGGSVLTLPMLVYVLGVAPKDAIAASLLVVGLTSAAAAAGHARAGRVDARLGLSFAAAAMLGAYLGGRAARLVPPGLLLAGFGAVTLAASVAMLRGPRASARTRPRSAPTLAAIALAVGGVSGLVGAGGGFVVVPALTLLAGLPLPRAIGTSLLVIALQSLSGFAGHAADAHLDVALLAVVSSASIAGSAAGVALSRRVRALDLRTAFGWLVLVTGAAMLLAQLPAAVTRALHLPSLAAGAALVALAWAVTRLRASTSPPAR